MLFSAPLEVARTKACTVAPSSTSASVRCEPMKPSAPVTSTVRPVVCIPEVAEQFVERGACPEGVVRHRPYASASVSKRTESPGLGSLASAALTAVSTLVVTGFAAIVGVVIAHEFGRTEETDGFFAAYGVFIVIVLASQAIRLAVLPPLAIARQEGRLRGEVAGFGIALAVAALPFLVVGEVAARPVADLLTGSGSATAQDVCADALRWLVPAGIAYLFAGLAASGLAALDDYATAALGYALGGTAALIEILTRVDADGIAALYRGVALNGAIALAVPALGLAWRAGGRGCTDGRFARRVRSLRSRLGIFATAAALPIALQLLYVVCLPFAGRVEPGAVTSFGYAYLAAASFVSITAFSIGLVSSVPLTRTGLGDGAAARHVTAAAWVALTVIGGAVGAFAVAGGKIVESLLGDAYGGDVGEEVSRLVVVLAPWMVASVGVNVSFPLAFVAGRLRKLPVIGACALALQVALAWIGSELLQLDGLAVALTLSTLLVLAALLGELGALDAGLRGILRAAAAIAAVALVAFVPANLLLGAVPAAIVGVVLYAVLVVAWRPRGLTESWGYLRALR